jgi:para-nitrobenzyl esterase
MSPNVTKIYVPTTDEDCLNLNVYTGNLPGSAANPLNKSVPVMLWVHGGGLTSGCSAQSEPALYNGTNLQRQASGSNEPVVVVTINYRLSVFATLFLDELVEENPASSNFAFQDVLSALRWVRTNIAAFGGDPAKVTVFGESAGGNVASVLPVTSIAIEEASKGAPLFTRVISESGTQGLATGWINTSVAAATGAAWAGGVGCAAGGGVDLACLRAMPVQHLIDSLDLTQLGSVIDGTVLKQYPVRAYAANQAAPAALTFGWNRPDLFSYCAPYPNASAALGLYQVQQQLPLWTLAQPAEVAAVLEAFSPSLADGSCVPSYAAAGEQSCCALAEKVLRDAVFTCPARRLIGGARKHQPGQQWWYELHCCPTCPDTQRVPCVCQHTSEIAYVFATQSDYEAAEGNSSAHPSCSWAPQEEAFSAAVVEQWASLAANGTPLPASEWTPFDGTDLFSMSYDGAGFARKPWADGALCEALDAVDARVVAERFGA